MPDEFPYDVFLSHSAKDKAVVRPLAERLRQDGLKVWFDEWGIKPGDSIPAKIKEGLERSRVLVLCMSANAFGSDWAQLESGMFRFRDPLNKDRRLIPLRLDDAPVKGSLRQFHYINWHPADREQEYGKLREACGLKESRKKGANTPWIQRPDYPPAQSIGDAWGGLRGILDEAYSTKVIKKILGKAGLHLFRITDAGTYKGPVLDETDKLVRCMNGAERDQFVIGCIQELLSLERLDATNISEHRNRPDDKNKENLRVVLARFGHDLSHFE